MQYKKALEGGGLKVMAKMGISTLASYKGAQVFESVGLNLDLVHEYFEGTRAHLAGVGMAQVQRDLNELHERAFRPRLAGSLPLDPGGDLYWRREGEWHQWNPVTIGKLQQAACTGDEAAYRHFSHIIDDHSERLQTLRGLLDFKLSHSAAVPLSEVEPVEEILKRFSTGSMSFGALSQEAHETLAVAMNRIGGKSGTGEGGERIERFGGERECSMKQVASGRFGVTSRYLVQAKQI
jgi:glutamate synthase (NADPH/NADH) large chain